MRRTAVIFALAAACAVAPAGALAQARRSPPGHGAAAHGAGAAATTSTQPQDALTLRDAREALHSNDPDRVILAIDSLTLLGTADVIPPLVDLLRSGPTDRITDYTVEKLGIIGRPEAIEELSDLLHHRRATVRAAAIEALAQITDPRVRALIESGLHDSDPEVRGQAAEALGEISSRQSVPLLLRAFERGVPEAAEAIGKLGEASTAVSANAAWDREDPRNTTHPRTLAMWLGRTPLSVLLRGFEAYLNRTDIPVNTRIEIIVRLEQQASAQVRDFLQRWVSQLPPAYRGRDRARAELAIQQIRVPTSGGSR
jgi:HEAT repeat protein